jgi:hypothetical protein
LGFDHWTVQPAASRYTTYQLPHRQCDSSTCRVFKQSSIPNTTHIFEQQFKDFILATKLLGAFCQVLSIRTHTDQFFYAGPKRDPEKNFSIKQQETSTERIQRFVTELVLNTFNKLSII